MKSKLKPEKKLPKDLEKSCEELLAKLQEMEDTEVLLEILDSPAYATDVFAAYLSAKEQLTADEAEILGMCKMYLASMAAADVMFDKMKDVLDELKDNQGSTDSVSHEA